MFAKTTKKLSSGSKKAVEQGHVTAQNNLGEMYDRGLGIPQDYAKALMWYRKAAETGGCMGTVKPWQDVS